MNGIFNRKFFSAATAIFLTVKLLAADTNQVPVAPPDEDASHFLQMQEQIHAAQLAIVQSQQTTAAAARSNVDLLASHLQSLEQTIVAQRDAEMDISHHTQQMTLNLAVGFGLAGFIILLLMIYFQWRAFAQLAKISAHQQNAAVVSSAIPQMTASSRAAVESSNTRLLDTIGELEKRINELESNRRFLPETTTHANGSNGSIANGNGKSHWTNGLVEGQKFLETGSPQRALELFETHLAAHPNNAEALLKKAEALEKLGRNEEALTHYNRAIAVDGTLVIAHLHKGGLLNRLRRYDEALSCYEQALAMQDRKAKI